MDEKTEVTNGNLIHDTNVNDKKLGPRFMGIQAFKNY